MKSFLSMTVLLLILVGCWFDHQDSGLHDEPGSKKLSEVTERLKKEFLQDGMVVSLRKKDGKEIPEHVGDSLIWSGIALASLSCEDGQPIFDALKKMIEESKGALVRYWPLPEEYKDNATSRDQITGALFGLVHRKLKCKRDEDELTKMFKAHHKFVFETNKGRLYPGKNHNYTITPGFDFLYDATLTLFDKEAKVDPKKKDLFVIATGFTASTNLSPKKSCYPVHLTTINLWTIQAAGHPMSEEQKKNYCKSLKDASLPLTQLFCGHNDPKSEKSMDHFMKNFKYDEWEYRHQRCVDWEKEDNKDLRTPGIDYLVGAFALTQKF